MYDSLFPIIVPRSYFQYGNWPGPHRNLQHPELAVTWVDLGIGQTMTYVTQPRYEEVQLSGIDIHSLAMANLAKASEALTTHSKVEDDIVSFYAMMHADGLGTSRLLLLPAFDQLLPQGYWLGIPERSCGILVPKDVSMEARNDAVGVIQSCYEKGASPMLVGLFEREMFEVTDT